MKAEREERREKEKMKGRKEEKKKGRRITIPGSSADQGDGESKVLGVPVWVCLL